MQTVQQTKEVLVFILELAVAYKKAKQDDGKVTLGDADDFVAPAMSFLPAIMGIQKIGDELVDLSPEEAVELKDVVVAKLGEGSDWFFYVSEAVTLLNSVLKIYKKAVKSEV